MDEWIKAEHAALEAQLKAKLAGPPEEGQRQLQQEEVAFQVLQWSLLGHLRRADGARGLLESTLTSLGLSGGSALPQFPPELLQELLLRRDAVEALMTAGGSSNWRGAVFGLLQLLGDNPAAWQDGFSLRLAVAAALCAAEGETCGDFHQEPIDMARRYRIFLRLADGEETFPQFLQLGAWQLRYVLGSWHSDLDLQWARAHVEQAYRTPDAIGGTTKMVAYTQHNKSGVSVQKGLDFYDGQKATLPIIKEYGGVCGAVSKFGASCCQAFGVPAMPVGQPGHCAMLWRGPDGDWRIANGGGDSWCSSHMHAGIQRTWLAELGKEGCRVAGIIIPVMERAQASGPGYLAGERLRLAAGLAQVALTRMKLLAASVAACPYNLPAWSALLQALGAETLPAAERRRVLQLHMAAAEAKFDAGVTDVARLKPVLASTDQEDAKKMVNGIEGTWHPASSEPQWAEVDLQAVCRVEAVKIRWWGDYGSKTKLKLLSSSSVGKEASFTLRGEREKNAGFNDWTELRGWKEPTQLVRIELDHPSPDCFGLKKSYGVRCVQVLGVATRPSADEEAKQDEKELMLRWAAAEFKDLDNLGDQQALVFVKDLVSKTAAWWS